MDRGSTGLRYILMPVRTLRRDGTGSASHAPSVIVVPENGLAHWVTVATASCDACLVVDAGGVVAAVSKPAADMLGSQPERMVGHSLDEALRLVDFIHAGIEAQGAARRIPPLIALAEDSLSRGVIRLQRPDGERMLIDAVAAPIHDAARRPVGAVAFLASV